MYAASNLHHERHKMEYDVSFQTISWFNGRSLDGTLEINPQFQRRAVWLEKERSQLMETILSQLPFPEVYVHTETNANTGSQLHSVVDGQQRITSILMFIRNEVSLPNEAPWNGRYFRDLTEPEKQILWDYKIVVRSLRKTNDDEIRSLFRKLNTNNIVLNDQELRNARYMGRFKELSERLADIPFFQALGLFTARDVRRMLDIEYVSELLVRQIAGVSNKKDLLEEFYLQYDEEFPNESAFEDEFNVALNLARSVISPDNQTILKTKGNFYSLFGVCLEFYRATGKLQFANVLQVQRDITELVVRAKNNHFSDDRPDIATYSEVSTRSTSDKSRRAERERILYSIIAAAEGLQ